MSQNHGWLMLGIYQRVSSTRATHKPEFIMISSSGSSSKLLQHRRYAAVPDHLLPASRLINSQLPQPCAQERLSENSFKPNGCSLLSESSLGAAHCDAGTTYYLVLIKIAGI